jgi:Asp-tRNA(Asn)/Glu-tRNA(Gln) amidotransferase B subunit
LVASLGLQQVSDLSALAPMVEQVIAAKADEYRAGKTGLLGFFVGQVMRPSSGNADPAPVSQLVQEPLGA